MSRRQLALWAEGAESVKVSATPSGVVIEHRVSAQSARRELVLPRSRSLLVALREACDQALRAEVSP